MGTSARHVGCRQWSQPGRAALLLLFLGEQLVGRFRRASARTQLARPMGSGSSRSPGGGATNAAAVTTPRGQKISSVLPELIAETALAREDAIAECYATLARLDTSEQLGPLLALFLRLFPDTPEEELERLLTEGGEGAPVIASEAQLVELVNSTIDRLGAGPTGVRPVRWAAPAQRGDALLTIQKAVRQLVTRMAVVERFRFQLWDRLDGWEELELNQLGAFICE